jgi:hypothetical protein
VVYGITASGKRDITNECALTIDAVFGTFAGATVTLGSHGGKTSITAACGELGGSAALMVKLTCPSRWRCGNR